MIFLTYTVILAIHAGECFRMRGDFWYTPMKPPLPSEGVPWPLPRVLSFGDSNLTVDPAILEIITDNQCDIVLKAIDRYRKILVNEMGQKSEEEEQKNEGNVKNLIPILQSFDNDPPLKLLHVTLGDVKSCAGYPYLGMNENYSLIVFPNGTAHLSAPSVWGVLRGFETFSQLTFLNAENVLKVHTALIEDWPRFVHRGLLLDTSRHYLTPNMIKKNLNLMAHVKYNVFHWHIVDDQSFPYVSSIYPKLSRKGSYSPKHIYSKQVITDIIEYARLLGIRVIPEFDTPGHTLSWGKGLPSLLTQCYSEGKYTLDYGVLDPSSNGTYQSLLKLFTEILARFPDDYIHLGGDEVFFDCWESNMEVEKLMNQLGITIFNITKLEGYYIQKLLKLARKARSNVKYILWQDVLDNKVKINADTIVQVWRGNTQSEIDAEMKRITKMNLRTILSTCWYLDYIKYGNNWEEYYTCEPHHFGGNERQKELVIGGEACMWGEWVDGTNLIPSLWPRASVVAERLWSDRSVNDVAKAAPRLEEHRCRLVRRGYPVSSVNGAGYCQQEWEG